MNTQEILNLINIKLEVLKEHLEYAKKIDLGQAMEYYYTGKIEALERLKEQIETAEKNRKD